jgi:4-amino-4-deoxy-L-arabinose transferase-like glycosyltransferase
LILAGLALGSEKLSLGLIFLGGVLAAAAGACLTRKWASREWAWLSALTFLLTPVVFWQISASGAPDAWAAFFAATAVLVVARTRGDQRLGLALLAGILAGAIAGTKYTGCIIAASLALAFLWEARSARRLAVFLCGALGAGIWPYLRNALWTGDPVFPFLLHWFAPTQMNAYALASIMGDTGAATPRNLWQVAKFPFFAAVDLSHAGFWQFLGPLCLAFAPLVIWAARNISLWRTALIVWLVSSIGIGATSGMLRFVLPILPVALGMVFAGVAALCASEWRIARSVSIASISLFLLLGAGGLVVYERSAAAAAIGLTERETYLKQRAPDYGKTQFVNETLEGKGSEGKALVFFRHVYYLRVPFLYGDPAASWSIDPEKLQTPEAWRTFFHAKNIRWVVRAPDYPPAIAGALGQLEATGELEFFAQGKVSDFEGQRILGVRKTQPIFILRVKD